ncbi:hypothetical protein BJ912DRAFT_932383 [Pholiota molesta]|nr:hypothetical protein BJ912DRAFT_932383 [Pholiota molesta]
MMMTTTTTTTTTTLLTAASTFDSAFSRYRYSFKKAMGLQGRMIRGIPRQWGSKRQMTDGWRKQQTNDDERMTVGKRTTNHLYRLIGRRLALPLVGRPGRQYCLGKAAKIPSADRGEGWLGNGWSRFCEGRRDRVRVRRCDYDRRPEACTTLSATSGQRVRTAGHGHHDNDLVSLRLQLDFPPRSVPGHGRRRQIDDHALAKCRGRESISPCVRRRGRPGGFLAASINPRISSSCKVVGCPMPKMSEIGGPVLEIWQGVGEEEGYMQDIQEWAVNGRGRRRPGGRVVGNIGQWFIRGTHSILIWVTGCSPDKEKVAGAPGKRRKCGENAATCRRQLM